MEKPWLTSIYALSGTNIVVGPTSEIDEYIKYLVGLIHYVEATTDRLFRMEYDLPADWRTRLWTKVKSFWRNRFLRSKATEYLDKTRVAVDKTEDERWMVFHEILCMVLTSPLYCAMASPLFDIPSDADGVVAKQTSIQYFPENASPIPLITNGESTVTEDRVKLISPIPLQPERKIKYTNVECNYLKRFFEKVKKLGVSYEPTVANNSENGYSTEEAKQMLAFPKDTFNNGKTYEALYEKIMSALATMCKRDETYDNADTHEVEIVEHLKLISRGSVFNRVYTYNVGRDDDLINEDVWQIVDSLSIHAAKRTGTDHWKRILDRLKSGNNTTTLPFTSTPLSVALYSDYVVDNDGDIFFANRAIQNYDLYDATLYAMNTLTLFNETACKVEPLHLMVKEENARMGLCMPLQPFVRPNRTYVDRWTATWKNLETEISSRVLFPLMIWALSLKVMKDDVQRYDVYAISNAKHLYNIFNKGGSIDREDLERSVALIKATKVATRKVFMANDRYGDLVAGMGSDFGLVPKVMIAQMARFLEGLMDYTTLSDNGFDRSPIVHHCYVLDDASALLQVTKKYELTDGGVQIHPLWTEYYTVVHLKLGKISYAYGSDGNSASLDKIGEVFCTNALNTLFAKIDETAVLPSSIATDNKVTEWNDFYSIYIAENAFSSHGLTSRRTAKNEIVTVHRKIGYESFSKLAPNVRTRLFRDLADVKVPAVVELLKEEEGEGFHPRYLLHRLTINNSGRGILLTSYEYNFLKIISKPSSYV